MEQLLNILNSIKPGIDFEKEENLIEDGIITSLEIVNLVVEISNEFDIEISPLDIVPENFASAKTIMELIERLADE